MLLHLEIGKTNSREKVDAVAKSDLESSCKKHDSKDIALVIKCILVLPSPLSSCWGADTIYCNRDPVGGSLYVREEGVNGSGKNPRI